MAGTCWNCGAVLYDRVEVEDGECHSCGLKRITRDGDEQAELQMNELVEQAEREVED